MVKFEEQPLWKQLILSVIGIVLLLLILGFPIYTSIIPLYFYYQGLLTWEQLMALLVANLTLDFGIIIMIKLLQKTVKVKVREEQELKFT